jgi:hypothetical protein
LDDVFLEHLQLTRADFAQALTLEEARQRWKRFQRPKDLVVVFQPGTAHLFSFLAGTAVPCLVLKSVSWKELAQNLALDVSPSLSPVPVPPKLGRAGTRLAETISMVLRLNGLAVR